MNVNQAIPFLLEKTLPDKISPLLPPSVSTEAFEEGVSSAGEAQEERRCYTPCVRMPGCPSQAQVWAVTYIEEKSRDWCEALHMNQAQTVREVSFSGSNIK